MNHLWQFIDEGGVLMYPILAFSIIALAVFLERLVALRSSRVVPRDFLELIRTKLSAGRHTDALTLCEGNRSPLAAVVAAGAKHFGQPRPAIKEAFEEVGRIEVTHLGRRVEVVGTIAAVTPLLGLLGTVIGMIDVFRSVVAEAGAGAAAVDPGSLATGIWVALLTTAAGLSVAIPAYLGYRFLLSRVDQLAIEMEEVSLDLLECMTAATDESSTPGEAQE